MTTTTDKTIPEYVVLERSLIGEILLDGGRALDLIGCTLLAEDFLDPGHGKIFAEFQSLYRQDRGFDTLLLADRLRAAGLLDILGTPIADYLIECLESVPHAAHAGHHAKLIADKAGRRQLIAAGQEAVALGHDELTDLPDAVARADAVILKILERQTASETVLLGDVMLDVMSRLDERRTSGLRTQFHGIDDLLHGLMPGNLVVLAARPSIGKTALAVNLAEAVAGEGHAVGFISLEQSKHEIAERLMCAKARVSMDTARGKGLTEAQADDLLKAANELGKLKILIDECSYRGIAAIEASARLMKRRHAINLLIVDYLQLVTPQRRTSSREQEVAECSARLKALARSLQIPVLCLAQLNREVEKRPDKKPRLSDLRESGAVEQDADVVILLHRAEVYDPDDSPGEALAIVAKHRNGRTGEVRLQFEKSLMQFRDLYPGSAPPPMFSDDPHRDDFFM